VKSKAFDDDENEKKPEVKTPAKSNAGGVGGKRLFVGNLSFRATEDTL
jgi:hypothetical protein